MKKRLLAIILVILSLLFNGCSPQEFEYGSDKFYLEYIVTGGKNSTWYYFKKKVDKDMIMEPLSDTVPNGYELSGEFHIMGFWNLFFDAQNEPWLENPKEPYIEADFCCYYKEGMGNEVSNIYFNYTVASTGERKEEVWEVDFSQEPYEDKR